MNSDWLLFMETRFGIGLPQKAQKTGDVLRVVRSTVRRGGQITQKLSSKNDQLY